MQTINECIFISIECRFFRQYLVLVLVKQMTSALYRFVAALGRESTVALTLGSGTNATLLAMSGFVLSKGTMKKKQSQSFCTNNATYVV